MEIKYNDLFLLQSDSKHLKKLKDLNETMIDNYENKIFPSTIEKYYQNLLSLIFIQTKNIAINKEKNLQMNTKIEINKELYSIEQSRILLGNFYQIISDFFISLRKNEKIILFLIKNIKGESYFFKLYFFIILPRCF